MQDSEAYQVLGPHLGEEWGPCSIRLEGDRTEGPATLGV